MSESSAITEWLTVAQVAKALGYTRSHVIRAFISTGKLRAKKFGREYRISKEDYNRFCGLATTRTPSEAACRKEAEEVAAMEGWTLPDAPVCL